MGKTIIAGLYHKRGRNFIGLLGLDEYEDAQGVPESVRAVFVREIEIEAPANVVKCYNSIWDFYDVNHVVVKCDNGKEYYLDTQYGRGGVKPWWREWILDDEEQ